MKVVAKSKNVLTMRTARPENGKNGWNCWQRLHFVRYVSSYTECSPISKSEAANLM